DLVGFIIIEIADFCIHVHAGRTQNLVRLSATDAEDVCQSDLHPFVRRKIDSCYTCHGYPCLCLCFVFTQITRTTRLRCTILHLSQIFLTDALTFIIPALLLVSINDPATRQVVRRKLNRYLVAWKNANEILSHLSGNMSQHLMLVLQLHF